MREEGEKKNDEMGKRIGMDRRKRGDKKRWREKEEERSET